MGWTSLVGRYSYLRIKCKNLFFALDWICTYLPYTIVYPGEYARTYIYMHTYNSNQVFVMQTSLTSVCNLR